MRREAGPLFLVDHGATHVRRALLAQGHEDDDPGEARENPGVAQRFDPFLEVEERQQERGGREQGSGQGRGPGISVRSVGHSRQYFR